MLDDKDQLNSRSDLKYIQIEYSDTEILSHEDENKSLILLPLMSRLRVFFMLFNGDLNTSASKRVNLLLCNQRLS